MNDCKNQIRGLGEDYELIKFKFDKKIEGKRRALLKKKLEFEAMKDVVNDKNKIQVFPPEPSEYFNSFCDEQFSPEIENIHSLIEKQVKFPLYQGRHQTYYHDKFMNGDLKVASFVKNYNEPFRKNSSFTTPIGESLKNQ